MYSDTQIKLIGKVIKNKQLDPLYKPTLEEIAVIDAVLERLYLHVLKDKKACAK